MYNASPSITHVLPRPIRFGFNKLRDSLDNGEKHLVSFQPPNSLAELLAKLVESSETVIRYCSSHLQRLFWKYHQLNFPLDQLNTTEYGNMIGYLVSSYEDAKHIHHKNAALIGKKLAEVMRNRLFYDTTFIANRHPTLCTDKGLVRDLKTFLLINNRLQATNAAYLPRDVKNLIINKLIRSYFRSHLHTLKKECMLFHEMKALDVKVLQSKTCLKGLSFLDQSAPDLAYQLVYPYKKPPVRKSERLKDEDNMDTRTSGEKDAWSDDAIRVVNPPNGTLEAMRQVALSRGFIDEEETKNKFPLTRQWAKFIIQAYQNQHGDFMTLEVLEELSNEVKNALKENRKDRKKELMKIVKRPRK